MFTRIRGTRDILNTKCMDFIIAEAHKELVSCCFSHIQIPTLASLELFQRSLGNGTDVISKEMFLVNSTHESDESICLRPEATAQVMLAYLLNRPQIKPWRVFTHGSMFRHERPQKGRYREFTQISMEIIAGASPIYDVELIAFLNNFFKNSLSIKDFNLEINFIGSVDDRKAYKEALKEYIYSFNNIPQQVLATAQTNILRTFDLKDEECRRFMTCAPVITDYLSSESNESWQLIKNLLTSLGVDYKLNSKLVRGLDYYNNVVFEFTSNKLGAQNTFCGGGRYDDLAVTLGSREKIHAVGAAMGVDRLVLLLEENEEQNKTISVNTFIAAVVTSQEYVPEMLKLVFDLRKNGISIEFYADKDSLKASLRKADADGARAVIILGETEYESQSVAFKDLKTGEQTNVPRSNLKDFCLHALGLSNSSNCDAA